MFFLFERVWLFFDLVESICMCHVNDTEEQGYKVHALGHREKPMLIQPAGIGRHFTPVISILLKLDNSSLLYLSGG